MTHRTRLASLLWSGAVALALALSLVLMLQVKAVNSQVVETEKAIVSAKQQIAVLETEFQTRARQQQLVRWNEVDFGYVAPKASQFLDGRAQLAALGKPVEIMEDTPIRMAEAAKPTLAALPVDDIQAAPAARTAAKDSGEPVLKGTPEKVDAPVRLAKAPTEGPAMMRQLVARDSAAPSKAPAKKKEGPAGFAERFDLETVIAEGSN